MKILWVCNIALPAIAEQLGMEASNKEGWLTGLSQVIMNKQEENHIELAIAFPYSGEKEVFGEKIGIQNGQLQCYGFAEDTVRPECYSSELEIAMDNILKDFRPDVIHCFGTEYAHTLAVTKASHNPERILIGIQGLCSVYAHAYMANLPMKVQRKVTFRDWLKKDSIREQQEKFVKRGEHEIEAIRLAGNVTGRTHWDKYYTSLWNQDAKYYFLNETLRSNFYTGEWRLQQCERYSIFLSQGDYPIKGLHYVMKALPAIIEQYPSTHVYVAGNNLVTDCTLKDKIKRSAYGKYLLGLMKQNLVLDKVSFLGKLNANEMKERYLKSHLFLCPSSIENSPNSIGEAMLLGVPVVSADVGGISSVFEAGTDGILYEGFGESRREVPDEEEKIAGNLAAAVCEMWSDEKRLLEYSRNARAHAIQTHNADNNYETLMSIYRQITVDNN